MAGLYVVAIDGVADMMKSVGELDDKVELSAQQAINRTIAWARTQSARDIRRQVNFDSSYLTGKDGRLQITQRAKSGNLEAVITGRERPTSLARFSSTNDPGLTRRQGGTKVQVKPGSIEFMKGAFLMRLRAGGELTDTKFNLGLAIRLKPGERLRNKTRLVQVQQNLYLLYGPSVAQVFRQVSEQVAPDVEDYLYKEFNRLIEVKTRG